MQQKENRVYNSAKLDLGPQVHLVGQGWGVDFFIIQLADAYPIEKV